MPRSRQRLGWRSWLALAVYQFVFLLFALLYLPVLLWRLCFERRIRVGMAQRLGFVPRHPGGPPLIWVHGVSVGEIKAAGQFIARLRRELPGAQLMLSATTPNGFQMARLEHPDLPVTFYPLDFMTCPGRALDRSRPACVLLMELEIWPNFLHAAARRGVPVLVVNGRISERTLRGYRKARGLLPQLDLIETYCVQNDTYRQRLLELGVPADSIQVTGNMKYDNVVAANPEVDHDLRRWLTPRGGLVLVAGSTHGDEDVWLDADAGAAAAAAGVSLRVVLVPRHPERSPAVVEALQAQGRTVVRWSEVGDMQRPLPAGAVVVVDVIGQLQRFYGVCDLAFVGGSLVPRGGQNMLEPAALGRAVVFGPLTENFRQEVELLLHVDGAVRVRDRDELRATLQRLLRDPEARNGLGARGRAMILANRGATERTLAVVRPVLPAG